MESFILAAIFIFIVTVSFLMGMVWSKSKEEFLVILEQEVKSLRLEAKDLVVKVKNKLNVK